MTLTADMALSHQQTHDLETVHQMHENITNLHTIWKHAYIVYYMTDGSSEQNYRLVMGTKTLTFKDKKYQWVTP